jgi:putative hydrolase of the HAD superfamily
MVTMIFWDLGGVLLTNGWDRDARQRAAARFGFDWNEFEDRHEHVAADFETGRMDLDEYLERTILFEPRAFSRDDVRAFMFAQSRENAAALDLARRVSGREGCRSAVLNNESLELNLYRIERFRLREHFSLFFSSCFVGLRKPDPAIYRLALQVTQTPPGAALLVDDRAINTDAAKRVGMQVIHYRQVEQLRACLVEMGVEVD